MTTQLAALETCELAKPAPRADTSPTRVLIVDDHPLIREGLKARINREEGFVVCGEASDIDDAMELVAVLEPDLAIVDISLKTGNGLDLIQRMLAHIPDLPILVSSMHDEQIYVERSLKAGAKGFVHKREGAFRLIDAMRQVLEGRIYASDAVMQRLLDRRAGRSGDASTIDRLTSRELDVLERIGRGATTRNIAEMMNLSPKTVETYRDRIRKKLGIASAHELQRFAFQFVRDHNE